MKSDDLLQPFVVPAKFDSAPNWILGEKSRIHVSSIDVASIVRSVNPFYFAVSVSVVGYAGNFPTRVEEPSDCFFGQVVAFPWQILRNLAVQRLRLAISGDTNAPAAIRDKS